jgi:hypothetical protein
VGDGPLSTPTFGDDVHSSRVGRTRTASAIIVRSIYGKPVASERQYALARAEALENYGNHTVTLPGEIESHGSVMRMGRSMF